MKSARACRPDLKPEGKRQASEDRFKGRKPEGRSEKQGDRAKSKGERCRTRLLTPEAGGFSGTGVFCRLTDTDFIRPASGGFARSEKGRLFSAEQQKGSHYQDRQAAGHEAHGGNRCPPPCVAGSGGKNA